MKSVLLSIKPKYCELIASGKKTVEVRKTRPKIDVPFKGNIYCTKGEYLWKTKTEIFLDGKYNRLIDDLPDWVLNGKVIGEFICDEINLITQVSNMMSNKADYRAVSADGTLLSDDIFDFARLTKKEINSYLKGQNGYAFHISDLKIYDKPKELSEFRSICKYRNDDNSCQFENVECDCVKFDFNPDYSLNLAECLDYLSRPPQSWCYVEELNN